MTHTYTWHKDNIASAREEWSRADRIGLLSLLDDFEASQARVEELALDANKKKHRISELENTLANIRAKIDWVYKRP